jgi:fatty acid desaturase/ketosteroid isomerase-like protein
MSSDAPMTPAAPRRSWPIPVTSNIAIAFGAISVATACLGLAGNASDWIVVAAAAFAFSFANNTIFSLLHECVHRSFSPNRRLNDVAGVLFAAFFPTAFTIQRVSHFGHHRRNRTDLELYDYFLPHQSRWLKTYWIYCLLTGFYWAIIPVAGLVYVVCPFAFRSRWFQDGPARWWGFRAFVRDIADEPVARVWPEAAFTVGWQVLLWHLLDLDWICWLACYWAFGLNWSSLQYADHAWSPRDVHEGAWNLRFWPITALIFLNYNYHLAHHRSPDVPWLHLPRLVRRDDPRPSFWSIYWSLWGGARPSPPGPGPVPLPKPAADGAPATDETNPRRSPQMPRLLSCIAILLGLSGAAHAQNAGTPADHEALRKLKNDIVSAINNRDMAAADALLHKPFLATVVTQDSFNDFGKLKDYFEGLYTRDHLRMKKITMEADADELSQIYQGTFAVTRGSTRERYDLADGRSFDLNGRWTAVSMKDGDAWTVLAIHSGTNFLDNPVLGAIQRSVLWFGAGGLAIGLLVGFAAGWFIRRRRVRA